MSHEWDCIAAAGGGGGSCLVNFSVVNFAAGNFAEAPGFCAVNFADPPRNDVVCWALQAQWSLGATHNAEETHLPHSASDEGHINAVPTPMVAWTRP